VLEEIIQEESVNQLPLLRHRADEDDNGNGALMRIFPLYAYLRNQPVDDWFEYIWLHSALTHGHIRSAFCCFLYLRFCAHLVDNVEKTEALKMARRELLSEMGKQKPPLSEYDALEKLFKTDFAHLARTQVQGSGYVVECLEAALWCLFNADTYREAVLKAVNLGRDTDTTACVVGAPAALLYGVEAIPANWLAALARQEEIIGLGDRLDAAYPQ
jgi:ADP-ribosylglycohydrolase